MQDWNRWKVSTEDELQETFAKFRALSKVNLKWSFTAGDSEIREGNCRTLLSTAVGAQGLVSNSGFRNLGWALQKARLTCERQSVKLKEIRKSLFIHSLTHSFIHQLLTELETEEDLRMLYITKVISLQSQHCLEFLFNTFWKHKTVLLTLTSWLFCDVVNWVLYLPLFLISHNFHSGFTLLAQSCSLNNSVSFF